MTGSSPGIKVGNFFQWEHGRPVHWWTVFELELHFGEVILVPYLVCG